MNIVVGTRGSNLALIQTEWVINELKKKYPAACKFVNETNHVENDYIFQLDPFKFFQIPQFYLSEIETFLENEKETIIKGFNKGN